jgi:hypothetical protein
MENITNKTKNKSLQQKRENRDKREINKKKFQCSMDKSEGNGQIKKYTNE